MSPEIVPMAGGIFDWVSSTSSKGETAEKTAAVAVIIGYVIYEIVRSRLNLARIIIAALTAGVALWVINNVNTVQGKVGSDLDDKPGSSGPAITQVAPSGFGTPVDTTHGA